MMSQTNEKAFETYLEEVLFTQSGWVKGSNKDWDKERALFPSHVLSFIQSTQPKEWDEFQKMHGSQFETMLITTLVKELVLKGTLTVLRHGFKFYGKELKIAYFKPAHGLNQEVIEKYSKNQLAITRQVPCHPNDNSSIDLVFSLNGLPIATCELKNPSTHQNWRHAVKQYQNDRDPNAPLFLFQKRALVHFAVDPDEVYMTTRLQKNKTHFLPFNRGSDPGSVQCGAGNPQHTSGYRTGYFWQDILKRDSFLDIIGHYIFVEKKEEKYFDAQGKPATRIKEVVVFPRYHQLDAVRNLISTARTEGAGSNYLIQHSAGSGKTNSISWLSHRLASLHDQNDKKTFDCVVVITDRQVLDRQLQEAIYQIEHTQGVVKAIDQDSKQLAEALVDNTRIVITTLQKFPFILRGLLKVAGAASTDSATEEEKTKSKQWQELISKRRYAVIVDEAHSSQSGETSKEMKAILGDRLKPGEEGEEDWEDNLNDVMSARGRQPNISFFAFTATPKGKTLELFGRKRTSDKPEPFHIYSMRQAIEEGFILDVVKNYTTYKMFFKVTKSIAEDPELPKKKAVSSLYKFMTLHPHNIEQKIEIIVEHFRYYVKHNLEGRAKAMVVTSSRLHAVRYMLAFQEYIKSKGYSDVRPLVAFSGTVRDPDTKAEFTEPKMNLDIVSGTTISEKQLPERFASPDYQVLLVANKYQTGFDQPLLHAMYVDKRLDGVQAVQTLSRLNRMVPGKETPFVLDFVNEAEDIYKAFKPYYDTTSLQEISDPQQLEVIKHELDSQQVYHWSEVEAFAKIFYKPKSQHANSDHAQIEKHLQPSVDRFKGLPDDKVRIEFKDKLGGFVRVYSFLAQIMPYVDPALEMLYSFGRLLLPKLFIDSRPTVDIQDDVSLQYYRLQRISSNAIDLASGEIAEVRSPTAVGTGQAPDEKAPLSDIIQVLNDRFGTNFSEEDRFFFEQIRERMTKDQDVINTALANPLDKFQLGIKKAMEEAMIQRMGENDKIVTRYLEDSAFQNAALTALAKAIFDQINKNNDGK
jgi:type I restriction enzyme, R subunit